MENFTSSKEKQNIVFILEFPFAGSSKVYTNVSYSVKLDVEEYFE